MEEPGVVQVRLMVRGHVQGVYFRGSLQQQARQWHVTGWVRNCSDGSVEAVLRGTREAVDSVVAWVHQGPRGAVVASVDVRPDNSSVPDADLEIRR